MGKCLNSEINGLKKKVKTLGSYTKSNEQQLAASSLKNGQTNDLLNK
jgi:hypothetical protein